MSSHFGFTAMKTMYTVQIIQQIVSQRAALFNFHDAGPYHIETSPLIWRVNQWTGFYIVGASVMKDLSVTETVVLFESYHIVFEKYFKCISITNSC